VQALGGDERKKVLLETAAGFDEPASDGVVKHDDVITGLQPPTRIEFGEVFIIRPVGHLRHQPIGVGRGQVIRPILVPQFLAPDEDDLRFGVLDDQLAELFVGIPLEVPVHLNFVTERQEVLQLFPETTLDSSNNDTIHVTLLLAEIGVCNIIKKQDFVKRKITFQKKYPGEKHPGRLKK